MDAHPKLPSRRSIRLPGHDYGHAGVYFITICAYDRRCIFGYILDSQIQLNAFGEIVEQEWFRSAEIRPNITLDAFVVMPNHVHGTVFTTPLVGATGRACPGPDPGSPAPAAGPDRGSLGSFVGSFKAAATRRIARLPQAPDHPVWQRNYYEHIVRNERDLGAIQEYIASNPANWSSDRQNPAAASPAKFIAVWAI